MPLIPNFPANLLNEHMRWHHAHHVDNPKDLKPGYGEQFLDFHRAYLKKVMDWYNKQGLDPSLVVPWQSVPEPIRRASCYDQRAEARILYQPQSFQSSEELGDFIESSGLHGCIHQEAATLYGESDINDFDVAPRSTVFYNIHGMIERWYENWESSGRIDNGLMFWRGKFHREDKEELRFDARTGSWWLGLQEANELRWQRLGESLGFGPLQDGRPFRIWDTDNDGRKEIVFRRPEDGTWWEGRIGEGKLEWIQIRASFA